MNNYKLGSLFDGSGGFPLAGTLCGIEPAWAAEVEPYPIAVTRSRFPRMKHLGDISKVNGAEIEPVDIITFGSPCQDLSVAGKRAGLKHEANGDEETTRSGLFMEAVRIIKEMRNATNGKYPTYALWENVPGAFSSNAGQDFRVVCEELIKIVEPTATMPEVPQKGWNYADSYIGDGWSLAYRVLDAQYWGVPQRRRRIYLVADFRGQRAREILFEREGLRGYFTQGRTPWQTAPTDAQGSTGADDREGEGIDGYNGGDRGRQLDDVAYTLKIRSGCEGGGKGALVQENKSATLATNNDQYLFQPVAPTFIIDNVGGQAEYAKASEVNGTLRAGAQGLIAYAPKVSIGLNGESQVSPTLIARMSSAVGTTQDGLILCEETPIMQPFCKSARGKFKGEAETWKDVNTFDQGETRANGLVVDPVICLQGNGIDRADTAGCNGKGWKEDTAYTLNTIDRPAVVFAVDQGGGKSGANVHDNLSPTLCTTHGGEPAVAYQQEPITLHGNNYASTLMARDYKGVGRWDTLGSVVSVPHKENNYIVRRLTPTECARLQGFADRWGDIDAVDCMSAKDYQFWKEVRNTHARINGKKEQDYTVKQMLTWYNKLQTDSSEYKMWGNGIALPTALYVIQGIADALDAAEMIADELNGAEELVEDWML